MHMRKGVYKVIGCVGTVTINCESNLPCLMSANRRLHDNCTQRLGALVVAYHKFADGYLGRFTKFTVMQGLVLQCADFTIGDNTFLANFCHQTHNCKAREFN